MGKLQIIRFENDHFQIANLQIGNNIIGRNGVTGSSKGHFIKHAVTINLSPSGDITLTPYQVSPCYIKSCRSSRWHLLKIGTSVPIKPGDICSLLSDKCWFKIITMSETLEKNNHLLKRKCTDELTFEPLDKKICFDVPQKSTISHGDGSNESQYGEDSSKPVIAEIPVSSKENNIDASTFSKDIDNSLPKNNQIIPSQISEVGNSDLSNVVKENSHNREKEEKKVEADIKEEHVMPFRDNNESNTLVQQDTTSISIPEENKANISSAEQVKSKRNKCVYKDKCYRKNPNHKVKFSHPGDSDFEEVDERPECPYGVQCYRTNPQHKAEFQHSTMRQRCVPTPITPIRRHYLPTGELLIEEESNDESNDEFYDESADESDYVPDDDFDDIFDDSDAELDIGYAGDSDSEFFNDTDESNSGDKDSN